MITQETRNAVRKALGKGHVSKIQAFALEKGVTKESGEPYSISMISKVLSGERSSHALEEIILACADHYNQQKEKKQKRIETLSEKVKAAI